MSNSDDKFIKSLIKSLKDNTKLYNFITKRDNSTVQPRVVSSYYINNYCSSESTSSPNYYVPCSK